MSEQKNPLLRVQHLAKSFGLREVLTDINLDVHENEIVSILGPSGSGKSTFLRCLNLLEMPDSGEIYFKGEEILNQRLSENKYRAHVGMVFQDFNLFNNLTVLENCTIGQIQVLKRSKAEAKDKAIANLSSVGMAEFINARPNQLSGGQKQRVAIARALAMEPDLLLFDEPTSALDPMMVGEVLDVMQRLASQHLTMIIVTHEIAFAKKVSHRIVFMDGGVVVEQGSPKDIIDNPQHEKTKEFLAHFNHA
ncbi:MAG: amino acid ABC transporter ATP-binding protein [Coriobacteriia bacterium]|nr:amino acid ABC transporter ATP-binding protein [Coriobacteriia bacterium]